MRPTNDNQSCWQGTLSNWVLTAVACLGRGAALVLRTRSCSQVIVKSEICADDRLHFPAPSIGFVIDMIGHPGELTACLPACLLAGKADLDGMLCKATLDMFLKLGAFAQRGVSAHRAVAC